MLIASAVSISVVTSPYPAHPHDSQSTSGVRLHISSLSAARVVVLRLHVK